MENCPLSYLFIKKMQQETFVKRKFRCNLEIYAFFKSWQSSKTSFVLIIITQTNFWIVTWSACCLKRSEQRHFNEKSNKLAVMLFIGLLTRTISKLPFCSFLHCITQFVILFIWRGTHCRPRICQLDSTRLKDATT